MKRINARKSITARITLWSTLIMIIMVTLIFLIFRLVSSSILQKNLRGYLLSSVDENSDKIRYISSEQAAASIDRDNNLLKFGDGWLEIDDDFLDEIYEVQSALYTSEGKMLYGKNPIARSMEGEAFTSTRIYPYRQGDSRWFVYDRILTVEIPGQERLWIRGLVPLSSEEHLLSDIIRTAMVFLPILLVLGIAGSWLTARRALLPIRKVEQAASEITQGTDLARRIEPGDADAELKDFIAAFNGMLDRLEHAFEAEQQFTSDASHELRTPVSVIMAQTEFALEKERRPEEYRDALTVIKRQSRRMNVLISSMLDYTRLELRPENYPLADLDLSRLVHQTVQDLALIRYNNIELRTDIEEGIRIEGNQVLLERALQNLIDNAYKYGKKDGNIEVELYTDSAAGGQVICLVKDDGRGIAAEDQQHIFDRFYRADSSRSTGAIPFGVGLGLAMVRMIMMIHGGTVSVQSKPGIGSTFALKFPLLDQKNPKTILSKTTLF